MPEPPSREDVRQALRAVVDPELHQNIVDLGMVRSVAYPSPGEVAITVSLTTPGCPIRSHFQKAVDRTVSALPSVERVRVDFDVLSENEKADLRGRVGRPDGLPEGALAAVRNVICVGSGKGGVGKSTTTANLTAALHAEGKRAAALDADVWGYSIPRMLGVHGKPKVSERRRILPLVVHGGVKAMSIEFFLEGRDQAVVWRGPMLHKAIRQFLEDVDWGELDYLLIDLPPGTGDVSMTLAQLLPQAKFVIVTTPQPAAQALFHAARGIIAATPQQLGVLQEPSGPPMPAITGTALPMASG